MSRAARIVKALSVKNERITELEKWPDLLSDGGWINVGDTPEEGIESLRVLIASPKNTAELEARVEPLQPFKERIIELEAKRDQWRIAGEFWHKKHTALVDGLRGLYEGSVQYQEFRSVYDGSLPVDPTVYLKIKRDDVQALLDKEDGDG